MSWVTGLKDHKQKEVKMKFLELNSSYPKSVSQRFLEVFSNKIEEELGVKKVKCPLCLKYNTQLWVEILDMEFYGDGTPYSVIGKIDHCTCTNCGNIFFPTKIEAKNDPPGNYTAYHRVYHFYVTVRYSVDYKELLRLLYS